MAGSVQRRANEAGPPGNVDECSEDRPGSGDWMNGTKLDDWAERTSRRRRPNLLSHRRRPKRRPDERWL